MVVGALVSPCLLANPKNVVREDGTAVAFEQADSPQEEIRAAIQAIGDPFIKKNLLFFFASIWFYTYNFSGFNARQFNMRTRGLNSAVFWGAQMLAAFLVGRVLDAQIPPIKRARNGMTLVCASLV